MPHMLAYEMIQAPHSGLKRQSWAQNNTWLLIPPPAQNCQISAAKKACYNFPQHYCRGTRNIDKHPDRNECVDVQNNDNQSK